jgi:MFS family permease
VGLGGIVGPALGGLLTGTVGWRMLFAITAAAMLAISLTAQRTLRRRAKRPPAERALAASFDYWGAFTFSTFLLGALLTLTLGPDIGWLDPLTLAGIAGSALMLVLFLASERRSASPMLDLHLFRKAELSLGALAALVTFMGLAATRFLVPFFLQAVKGYSAAQVGLTIVPAAVVTAIAAPFAGRLADRFGVRFFANVGMAVTLLGFAAFTTLMTTTPVFAVVAALMLMSLGMSVFGAANSASILNSVDADAHGVASALVTLCRNSGNVVGVAFATVIVTLTMGADGYPPSLAAVDPAADPGILTAFTHGVGVAAIAVTAIAVVVLAILVGWSWRAARARR